MLPGITPEVTCGAYPNACLRGLITGGDEYIGNHSCKSLIVAIQHLHLRRRGGQSWGRLAAEQSTPSVQGRHLAAAVDEEFPGSGDVEYPVPRPFRTANPSSTKTPPMVVKLQELSPWHAGNADLNHEWRNSPVDASRSNAHLHSDTVTPFWWGFDSSLQVGMK